MKKENHHKHEPGSSVAVHPSVTDSKYKAFSLAFHDLEAGLLSLSMCACEVP